MNARRDRVSISRFDAIPVESLHDLGQLKWALAGPDRLGACVAEMDFGTAPAVTAVLRSAVDRSMLGYLPPALTADLSKACASWQYDNYGWDVAPDDVRALPDVIRALHVAIDRFSRPGSPVIVPVPAYMPFLVVPGLLGRRVIQVELVPSRGRYVYDLDALGDAYLAGGHLLVLCNPHNPVGRVLEFDELVAISEVVDRHGGRVFSDEVHAPLVYPGHRHVPYASTSEVAAGHTITATSASKAWNLAGLKCAQVLLSNDADRQRFEQLGRLHTDGTSTLGVLAATAAYREGRPWLDAVLNHLQRNRLLLADLLDERLPAVGYTPPEGTYLGWLDFRTLELPDPDLAGFFGDLAGVTTTDGGSTGPPGRGFIRLNFATTRTILTQMVTQLADAVDSVASLASLLDGTRTA